MHKHRQILFILLLACTAFHPLIGQQTSWITKSLGNGKEVYRFSIKVGFDLDQLRSQFPIRFEIEWTYSQKEHLGQLSSSELKQIRIFEKAFQQALDKQQMGIWIGGFETRNKHRWIIYVKGETEAYKLMATLKEKLPDPQFIQIFEEEDVDWQEYKELKELILEP